MCLNHDGTPSRTSAYDAATLHHGIHHDLRDPTEHIHNIGEVHQSLSHNHPNIMYGTMRPNQRHPNLAPTGAVCMGSTPDASLHEFVPPPPPMFENGGGSQCPVIIPSASSIHLKNDADDKKSQKAPSKQGDIRPVVAPKPKINGKGADKPKEKKKRESTV